MLAGRQLVGELLVEGRRIVADGRVVSFDLERAIARQGQLVQKLQE